MSGKEDYVRRMHAKLDDWNRDLEALLARKDAVGEQARADYARYVDELRERRDDLQARLKILQEESGSAWQDMKAGIDLAWEAIAQAIDSARSRFK